MCWCVVDPAWPCCRSMPVETGIKSAHFFFDFNLLISARMLFSRSNSSTVVLLSIKTPVIPFYVTDRIDTFAASAIVTCDRHTIGGFRSTYGFRSGPKRIAENHHAFFSTLKPWQNDWAFALSMDWTNVHLV